MSLKMTKIVKKLLNIVNIGLTKNSTLVHLEQYQKDISQILELPNKQLMQLIEIKNSSTAQLKQDLFVLLQTNFKKDGFFVEFGATDGLNLSNTYLLEKQYQWTGILAEPLRYFHESLKKNRSCHIETNCIWSTSNSVIDFIESDDPNFSTIKKFKNFDLYKRHKSQGYQVQTISLNDLLKKYNAPKIIDYLSIDTEGSEFEILNNFNFNEYHFKIITCEHNFNKNREKIHSLLKNNGYERKYIGFSNFDDWYIKIN
jgi:FkbM family methyltransferase